MATVATYFGLGQQTHRSLDDVRMNLEVLKHCATFLFLESSLPEIFTDNSWVSPNATTTSRSGINAKLFDNAGRPRLNIVFDAPPKLCEVLDACDGVAQRLSTDSGSDLEWRPVVIRKEGLPKCEIAVKDVMGTFKT